jgi:hypothetical protein
MAVWVNFVFLNLKYISMANKLEKAFEQFQQFETVSASEMEKIAGGTCIFYSSGSWGDCDRDDSLSYTLTGGGDTALASDSDTDRD